MASGNMQDLRERIVLEVDGGQAQAAFQNIASSAEKADKAINNLGGTADKAGSKLGEAGKVAETATSKFDALQQSLFGVRGKAAFIWDLAIDGFRAAIGFAESFIERASAVQRTMSLLSTIPGGGDSQNQFAYLTQVANNYGLSLRAIQDDYAKLNLAAQNTAMTSDQVRRVFEQVSMATRTLHLNQQQTQLTFLAVEQMLSKGKLSMEELRKQFAERIPGAMQALAKELGVTYPVLEKFITKMGAASDKVVPELGNAIQRLYQEAIPNAAKALDAEKNRIETTVAVFFKNVVESGGTEGMSLLLRTINNLMQTENVASVFSRAMNTITTNIATFLGTLRPDDVDRFATSVLDFLSAFASLAMAAGKAVVFLGQNMPAVAAAFGAFMGATAGAPLGPWGAAIGMITGGVGGFLGGKAVQGSSSSATDVSEMMKKYDVANGNVNKIQGQLEGYDKQGFFSRFLSDSKTVLQMRLDQAKKDRDAVWAKIEPYAAQLTQAQAPANIEMPQLGELPGLITDPKKAMEMLRQRYGLNNGDKTKEQQAAERLAERQKYFIESLQNKVDALQNPEEERFDKYFTDARKLGIPQGGDQWRTIERLVGDLQSDYNKKQQDKSNVKTQATERSFDNMTEAAMADIGKFRERYDKENLKQVDDSDWATKARKMGSDLDAALIEQKKKWDTFARENPLFNFGFDREARLAEMRQIGDDYISEFKRIEQERRTIQGGAKQWLADYNRNATDYGKQTYQFLDGIKTHSEDMLFQLVKTGEFSFRKLGEFILDYMIKMAIAKAMTPIMNAASGWITTGLGAIFSAMGGGTGGAVAGARADGGPVSAGNTYWVGERGMELFTPSTDGYIHPNESIRSGGTGEIRVEVNIDNRGNTATKATEGFSDLGRRVGDMVRSVLIEEQRPGGMLANG